MQASEEIVRRASLLSAMRSFIMAFDDSRVTALAAPLLNDDLTQIYVESHIRPVLGHLIELDDSVLSTAQPMYGALGNAVPALRWQVSYNAEDGFSDSYLDNYAWCDVIGPQGIFMSHDYRIGFGYWRQGIQYPTHAHEPEEIYLVLAGSGVFTTGDASPRRCEPGSVVHHTPFLPHSIDMSGGPLLVMFFWHGQNLHKKSDF